MVVVSSKLGSFLEKHFFSDLSRERYLPRGLDTAEEEPCEVCPLSVHGSPSGSAEVAPEPGRIAGVHEGGVGGREAAVNRLLVYKQSLCFICEKMEFGI